MGRRNLSCTNVSGIKRGYDILPNGEERNNMKRVLHFPVTRIAIGVVVCWIVLLGTNSILRLVFSSEGDIVRVIRWLLSTLVLVATYHFLFRRYENRAIIELSKTGLIRESLIGLFTGALCIAIIIGILYALGYYEVLSTNSVSTLILTLLLFATLSVFEELTFRGIIYRIVEESLGTNLALVISALLFGLAHLPNEHANTISVISAVSGGILAGLLFSMTKRLWLPIFFHTGWNWAQASLGVEVSGIEELPGFLNARLAGPDLITGGAFGPENSVITVGFVLILSAVAYYLTLKRGNVVERTARR
jgi:membrane protease YdiL (CAAX protease family)